ncbi:MAG: hypothetical protein GTN89_03965, partial [Acidobacteria bacterium]|nr:hypothetical protein [Acidobacteriota bacterium]
MIVDTTCGALFGPCSSPSIVDLPPQTVSGTDTFEACNELRAGSGGFVVAGTADVAFEAGNIIKIQNGFSVESGARFRAEAGGPGLPGDPPPSAPRDLVATAGDGQVSLDWLDNPEPDLAGYRVLRAVASGGPYTEIAGLLAASSYLDPSVSNGTTYFYVVTAEDNGSNQSTYSDEA